MGRSSNRRDWERETVACFDLLLPDVAEVIGGSLREENQEILSKLMKLHELDSSQYVWYLDLRKYGSAPHGGFGLGFDRLVQYLTDTQNIRDVVFIPRAPGQTVC